MALVGISLLVGNLASFLYSILPQRHILLTRTTGDSFKACNYEPWLQSILTSLLLTAPGPSLSLGI